MYAYNIIMAKYGLVGLAMISFGHKMRCFGHQKKVIGDWWLSWPCGIGHDIVWAQNEVFWAPKKVIGDW